MGDVDAVVGREELVDCSKRHRVLIICAGVVEYLARPEGVVEENDAPQGEARQDLLGVGELARHVGVDEREVDRFVLWQRRERGEARRKHEIDPVGNPRHLPVHTTD